jgi:carboxypeptidase C (cathepsin A)
MSRNPYLKVWVCCGYYDLATPYFAAKTVTAQMELDPSIRSHLTLTYYPAGHMIYIDRPSQTQFKRDFESFLGTAVLPESDTVPNAAP